MDCIGSHCVGQRGSTEKNNNTSTLPSNSIQQLPVEKMSEDHHHHTPSMDHNHPSQMEMKVNSRQEGEEESGGHSHLRTPACNPSTDLSSDFCKCKILLNFEDAPDHLKFNPYIRSGYRTFLSTNLCLQSMFWWTNETINIWSHLVGCILFIGLTVFDWHMMQIHAELSDRILVVCLLVCFCLCMLLSSIYHIFSCKSEEHYEIFLSVDYIGITLSLVAIYISSMYYAFWCFKNLRVVYSVIAVAMFALAMVVQIPKLQVSLNAKIGILVTWAAYGVIPLGHWTVIMGGSENELVKLMLPRVIVMYGLCLIAFIIYAAKVPERWLTGKVDFVGHSHNWWHLFILAAFYHWHNTGLVYADYRLHHGCHGPMLT